MIEFPFKGVNRVKAKAFLLLLTVTAIWGTTFPFQKIIIEGVSPLSYISIRFLLAALVSFLLWGKGNWKYGSILGIILALSYTTQTVGLKFTTASKNGFFTSLYVVLVPLVSRLIEKERMNLLQGIGITLAGIGSYFLSGGVAGFNIGDFLSFLCAVGFAFHVVLITVFSRKIKEEDLLTPQFAITGLLNALLAVRSSWHFNLPFLAVAAYTALLATVFGIWIQVKYQKVIGSNTTAIVFAGEPVFAALFSFLIIGEVFTIFQIIGGAMLVSAIIISGVKVK